MLTKKGNEYINSVYKGQIDKHTKMLDVLREKNSKEYMRLQKKIFDIVDKL